ncbi:MAG: hypothetical protein WCT04_01510 [Planctomycetota bacterium]
MKPSLSISANATPGIGGQGLNFQHMPMISTDFSAYAMQALDPTSRFYSNLGKLCLIG